MGKHGQGVESQVRDHASAIAEALGRYSDEQLAIGPWFATLALLTRALADKLWTGELDELIKQCYLQPPTSRDLPTTSPTWKPPVALKPSTP